MNAIPRLSTLLSLCALMAACASAPPQQQPEKLFADELFRAPAVRIDAAEVFALTPDMHAYLEHDVGRLVRTRGRQQGLYEALYTRGQLQLEYDAAKTRNAAEAFAARQGNCLSLVIMTAAFAKEMGLNVRYQNVYGEETWARDGDFYLSIGHVNLSLGRRQVQAEFGRNESDSMTIDFVPSANIRSLKTWAIEEPTIVAMYMNNRAVESLTANALDDAYWWAREAILQDARFMSAYNTLGVVFEKHGNLAEAQRAFEFVLEREPANTRALSNLAEVFYAQGRVSSGREIRAKLDRMEPNPPFGYSSAASRRWRKATTSSPRKCSPRRSSARLTTTSSISGSRSPTPASGTWMAPGATWRSPSRTAPPARTTTSTPPSSSASARRCRCCGAREKAKGRATAALRQWSK